MAGTRSLLRTGSALAVVVISTAVVVGPRLPGADDSAVIPWRASDRHDGSSRVTVSPLVDIKARLVDQAQAVVFTVASPARSYWRLTSLETFDGRIWSSTRSYKEARGALPAGTDLELVPSQLVTQEYEIGALASIWLPAAYRPVGIDGTPASFDADSGSLIVPEEIDVTQAGQRYTITSVLPQLTGDVLGAVPAVAPEEIAGLYTSLPDDFSIAVQEEAFRITAADPTPYAKALALQNHFRSGAFTYDLDVERGHSGDALEHFLFESRSGYCEQFAGAYAAMARAIGLPARVAVGFTPGEPGPDGRFVVRGLNGHAWPEVYLDGYGWVPFEPTPGRGIPGATDYTGVPEQQAAAGDPTTGTTLPPVATPQEGGGGAGATPQIPDIDFDLFPDLPPPSEPSPWPRRLLAAAVATAALAVLWVGVVAAGTWLHRRRRRARAKSPAARVALAWTEVGGALASVGARPRRSDTPREAAARAASVLGVDRSLLDILAAAATTAAFAAGGVDDDAADNAEAAAAALVAGIAASRDRRERLRQLVDPAPFLAPRAARRSIGGTGAEAATRRA